MDSPRDKWSDFVSTHSPEEIARQLLQDKACMQQGSLPSTLACYLPKVSTPAAAKVGAFLAPPATDLHPSIARLLYDSIRSQLLQSLKDQPRAGDGGNEHKYQKASLHDENVHDLPDPHDIDTTLTVLTHLGRRAPSSAVQIDAVVALLRDQFGGLREAGGKQPPGTQDGLQHVKTDTWRPSHLQQRRCYICQYGLNDAHPSYKSMCRQCGDFNLASLRLSSPASLSLSGRTALVTGARVNLGYHVTLRLLRCGAMVVASTRYPNDAASRYAREEDFEAWRTRLRIVGADFRTARDAFALVEAAKKAVGDWGQSGLDILVNNAAQTLTDSVKKEERALVQEQRLALTAEETGLLQLTPSYQPQIRAGVAPLALYAAPGEVPTSAAPTPDRALILPNGVKDDGRSELEPYFKSSWVQTLGEIPYEDVVSAHAVNTFVPLILCRELLPMMGTQPSDERKPRGYIINVSSREGVFERTPAHPAKRGEHVHTNMTKAALNMLTQTEAAAAWRARRVAINSVDPGYMSAAPEKDALYGGVRPIGWEDGAGRVLWPVAVGEVQGDAVWGRLLKHYGAVEV